MRAVDLVEEDINSEAPLSDGDEQRRAGKRKPKPLFGLLVLIVVLSFPVLFIVSEFSYIDPLNLCYIRIRTQVTSENQDSIEQAIDLMKIENKESYDTLCTYVSKIHEENCISSEKKSPHVKYLAIDGCYIKGTKVVYVQPENRSDSDDLVESRKNALMKYSAESKKFWSDWRSR